MSFAPKSGPTAKKDPDQRLGHRTKAEKSKTEEIVVSADGSATPPVVESLLAANPQWHSSALAFWEAFLSSPLNHLYQQTDIVAAWYTTELISNSIKAGTPPGMSQHIRMYLNDLGATESARRAMDIKIRREHEAPDPRKVANMERARALRDRRSS